MSDLGTAKGEIKIDGDKLRAAARLQGMSLTALAAAMDMHYNGILRIAKEGSTSLNTLEKLCNVLNCSPLDLLVWDGYPAPKSDALASLFYRLGYLRVPDGELMAK